jgi:hypothetical protein
LLPVRQSIGQFLAAYAPGRLAEGLQSVTVTHAETLAAEARVSLAWLRRRLSACGAAADKVQWTTQPVKAGEKGSLGVSFTYAEAARHFRWSGDLATKQAVFEADLGSGQTRLQAAVSLLPPENALSEAMFF